MSKRQSPFLSRLWKKSAFTILSQPGKQESDYVFDNMQTMMGAYCEFEQKILFSTKNLRMAKLNLPALAKIRNELINSRARVQKFIQEETQIVARVLSQLGQFRYLLQKSEMNAFKEYYQKINQSLSCKEYNLNQKKIEAIHQSLQKLTYTEKQLIRDSPLSSQYEKWLSSFSIRSQDFFRKAYSTEWERGVQEQQLPFIKIKYDKALNSKCFSRISQISEVEKSISNSGEHQLSSQQATENGHERSQFQVEQAAGERMDDEHNDIVSQIYKEFQK